MLNLVKDILINTDRLILRKFIVSDSADVLNNWASKEDVQFNYGEPVYKTIDEVESLLKKYIEKYDSDNPYRWAIILKETNECIGQIAYFLMDFKNEFAEIEYCIGTDFQNLGYAIEATKAVIDFGFDKINLHKIQICCRPINEKSNRVIDKCGFTYEGTLRDYFKFNDGFQDRKYYSILKDEYKNKA